MPAIHREGVLRQIVGADGKEIGFLRERLRNQRSRWHFDHHAYLDAAHLLACFLLQNALGRAQFVESRDHREHHMQIADGRRPQDRAQLRPKEVGQFETHAHAAQAEKRVVFLRQRHIRKRFVAADIERANDERTLAAERFGDGAVLGRLFFFGRRGVAIVE